jgi:hypothetical protein
VVELLEDSAAAEVEDHLVYCLHCRDTYLMMHTVLGGAQGAVPVRDAGDISASNGAKVVNLDDFRRQWR